LLKVIGLFAIIILLLLTINFSHSHLVSGSNGSRLQIKDGFFDWVYSNSFEPVDDRGPQPPSIDIRYVTVAANAKEFEATLWLGSGFIAQPAVSSKIYGIFIDVDPDVDPDKATGGPSGIDYIVTIEWKNGTGTWTMSLKELSATGESRPLQENNIASSSYKNAKEYLTISVSLDSINSPAQYKVAFFTQSTKGQDDPEVMDFTNWLHIPPPSLHISSSGPLELGAGEEKAIDLKIESTSGLAPFIQLYDKPGPNNQLSLRFRENGDKFQIPSYGMMSTTVYVKASPNGDRVQQTIPIFLNSTFPSEPLIEVSQKDWQGLRSLFPDLKNENVTSLHLLTVSVRDPVELYMEFISQYWPVITSIATAIVGLLTSLHRRRIKGQQKYRGLQNEVQK
jgi:hypothetical protein